MQTIIHLSNLLAAGETMLDKLRSRNASQLRTPEQGHDFNQRYTRWCEESSAALPDDLREIFERERTSFRSSHESDNQNFWSHSSSLLFVLEEQYKQLFLARRRLWQPTSSLPEVRSAVATAFRNTYEISTIDKLFVDSGCEQHWYVPTTETNSSSKAMSHALGWLDGILLYDPDQERAILRRLCDTILANPRLRDEHRERIENALPSFQAPAPTDILGRYNLHPTVHAAAAPLVAIAHYDEAILKACIALNNTVQARAKRPDLDGSKLMQQVFSPNGMILTLSSDTSEQQGWMQLFTGVIQALRNPRAHKLGHATSLEETIEWLNFLSALFRVLERATP